MAQAAKPSRRRLPIFEGLLPIDTSRVPSELIAGATLGYQASTDEQVRGKGAKALAWSGVPAASLLTYAAERAELPLRMATPLHDDLTRDGLDGVYRDFQDFYAPRADTTTGQVTNQLGQVFDVRVIENTNARERRYAGLNIAGSWRGGGLPLLAGNELEQRILAQFRITGEAKLFGQCAQCFEGFGLHDASPAARGRPGAGRVARLGNVSILPLLSRNVKHGPSGYLILIRA